MLGTLGTRHSALSEDGGNAVARDRPDRVGAGLRGQDLCGDNGFSTASLGGHGIAVVVRSRMPEFAGVLFSGTAVLRLSDGERIGVTTAPAGHP